MPVYTNWKIYFLEYTETKTAEDDTTGVEVYIQDHGLEIGDMIVNITRRTDFTEERGCRLVYGITNEDQFSLYTPMTGQMVFDTLRFYKWIDRTDMLITGSLTINRKISGQSDCDFILETQHDSFFPTAGQMIKITVEVDNNVTTIFKGVINNIDTFRPDGSLPQLHLTISCVNKTRDAIRRTVRVNYSLGTNFATIVTDMLNLYLIQEGIELGDIVSGVQLDDDWTDDCVSISDVLDRAAASSGYQWFVDDVGKLYFLQEIPIVDSVNNLVDYDFFTDFYDIRVTETLDGYANKVFFTGGSDGSGNPVIISVDNTTEINAIQDIIGGSGAYGTVVRDGSINESEYYLAESGTDENIIAVSSHSQETGWTIWNLTRGAYAKVTTINGVDSFEITPSITGQTTGDKIVFFFTANKIISNTLKKRSKVPKIVTFGSGNVNWIPGTKLLIDVHAMNLVNEYYLIDTVNIYDAGSGEGNLRCKITAVLRDGTEFSTQRNISFMEYLQAR